MDKNKLITLEYNVEFGNNGLMGPITPIIAIWAFVMYWIYNIGASLFANLGLFDKAAYIESQGLAYLVVGIGFVIVDMIIIKN